MMTTETIRIQGEESYDVVVCGGGTAGFCAAVAAAREGAKTCVLERFGALGGTMTIGGVSAPALFHAHGKQIIAGIGWELMTTLAKNGFAQLPPAPFNLRHPQMAVELNAFEAEVEMNRMAETAGVHLCYHQPVVYVCAEGGHVSSVLISTQKGLKRICGKVFIDCSGDGSVSVMAGAEYELSDELQPASLNSILMNLREAEKDDAAIKRAYNQSLESGDMQPQDIWGKNIGGLTTGRGRGRGASLDECYAINPGNNLNHVYPFNGADEESRTRGEIDGRESIARTVKFVREHVPGYERAYVASVSPLVSERESRRIVGNAYVTVDDYVNGVCPPDSVCYSFYPVDVHRGTEDKPLDNVFLDEGRVPGIPLGALIARGFDNLMMAGRIASGDRRAQSAYRVQASCMAMGEATGTAAAAAAKRGVRVTEIDVDALRRRLHDNGVLVPGIDDVR